MTHPQSSRPSPRSRPARAVVRVDRCDPLERDRVGVPVGADGAVPRARRRQEPGSRRVLGVPGTTLALPDAGAVLRIAVGIGDLATADAGDFRAAGAAFARAAAGHSRLALVAPSVDSVAPLVEGVLLARYRYDVLRSPRPATPLDELTIVAARCADAARQGVARGRRSRMPRCSRGTSPTRPTAT